MAIISKLVIVFFLVTMSSQGAKSSESNDLGMFKGRKRSELPDNYREINTPNKLEAFRKNLEIIPKNAIVTTINGKVYRCLDRGGHDLDNGIEVYDMRCWKQ